jgi:hypothetical protein
MNKQSILITGGTGSLGNALWPLALQEGRNRDDNFKRVGRVWDGVYFSLTVAGVTFALFAHEIIDALTNGKFVEAALWAPILVAYLLIQNSGKAATAILYASMKGALVARLRSRLFSVRFFLFWRLVLPGV